MKLTPIDIRKWEFRKGVRGYDKHEVEAFLELAAEEFEKLQQERREFEQKSKRLEYEIEEYKRVEKSLQDTLISAKETTDRSMQNSRKEAELILGDAELTADKIIETARKKSSALEDDITRLKIIRDSFVVKLRGLLSSQLDLLEIISQTDVAEKPSDSVNKVKKQPPIIKAGSSEESVTEMMDDFVDEKK